MTHTHGREVDEIRLGPIGKQPFLVLHYCFSLQVGNGTVRKDVIFWVAFLFTDPVGQEGLHPLSLYRIEPITLYIYFNPTETHHAFSKRRHPPTSLNVVTA
jgi:hypothetical protein